MKKNKIVQQWLLLCVMCWVTIFMVGFEMTMWVNQQQILKESIIIMLGLCSAGCLNRATNIGLEIR